MTGGHHPHTESFIAGQAHRGDDIRSAGGHDHERGVLVGVQIPGLARLVVALFAWRVGGTSQACSKLFERRAVDDRFH